MSDNNDIVMTPSLILLSNGDELMGMISVMPEDAQVAILDPLKVVRSIDPSANTQSHMLYRWVIYSDDRIFFVPLSQVITVCNLSENNVKTYDKARRSFYIDLDKNPEDADATEDEEQPVELITKRILH